jgi:hypothetical protein
MPRVFNCICIAAAVERSGTCNTHEKLSLSLPSVARLISTTRAVWTQVRGCARAGPKALSGLPTPLARTLP